MKYIYANFKTNLNLEQIEAYFAKFNDFMQKNNLILTNKPLIFLNQLYILPILKQYGPTYVGVQSFDPNDKGSFTSSVSYKQIVDENIQYVLLGHYEEMKYFNETLANINTKVKLAVENKLNPVLCFGDETKTDLDSRLKNLEGQLDILLKNVTDYNSIVLAYEPKWAIGSAPMETAEIEQTIKGIKSYLFSKVGHEFVVLYGGSVNKDNISSILANADVDGVLIGSASLNVDDYIEMLNNKYAC